MRSRHASPFSLQRLNEKWRWMEPQKAANRSEQAHTNPQTAVGETFTGSSTQFSSSVFSRAPHPFDVRENPFHKRQQGYVFTEWRLMCMCVSVCVAMAAFVQAQCLHILSATLAVCASQCLSMSERIPLCVGCTISHREGMRGLAER